jgi:ADP-heptose:LPS heptosyltransferase
VLTTPVVRCLKKQLKDSEIHFATKRSFAGIVETNPYLDKKFYLGESLSPLIKELKKERYDYIIDLHHNQRTFLIKLRLGVKSFSFPKLNFEKWLMVNFKINRLPDIHIVDRYFETVKSLGVKNDGEGLDYFIPSGDEVSLSSLPASHRQGYTGFVIGAKHNSKKLPVEKIISICRKIQTPVILLGGPEDRSAGERIASEAGEHIYNTCGKYSLNQSASLVKQAQKIITHDTGLMHIAAAFNKEIISIWGNTIPEFGMYPYQKFEIRIPIAIGTKSEIKKNYIVEIKGLSCRPCTKIGYDKCPKGHFNCMNLIPEENILSLLS